MTSDAFSAVVRKPGDLMTPREKTVQGFIDQARQKKDMAARFVKDAKLVKEKLTGCQAADDILAQPQLKSAILYSAGLSEKAQAYFTNKELSVMARAAIEQFQTESDDLPSEVLHRYLLTAGDTLGGSMRNITGSSAQLAVAMKVIEVLELSGAAPSVEKSPKGKIQLICWDTRILFFDKTPKFIRKNLDVILLAGDFAELASENPLESKSSYVVIGELKGGIDPAGADEHWKTARSALDRVRAAFKRERAPKLFFAAAAVEEAMATEIYNDVRQGKLDFAANLTSEEQTNALISWMISL